jgi:hypothetical protein
MQNLETVVDVMDQQRGYCGMNITMVGLWLNHRRRPRENRPSLTLLQACASLNFVISMMQFPFQAMYSTVKRLLKVPQIKSSHLRCWDDATPVDQTTYQRAKSIATLRGSEPATWGLGNPFESYMDLKVSI